MTSQDTSNPFLQFKARRLVLAALLIGASYTVGLGLLAAATGWKLNNPLVGPLLYMLIFGSLYLWIVQRFDRLHVNFNYVIGRIPNRYKWLRTAGLVIAVLLFSLSAFLLSFYLLSFAAPAFVETFLRTSAQNSTTRPTASLLSNLVTGIAVVVVAPFVEEVIFRGVLLQRWAVKWGVRASLILTSLLFGLLHANVIGLTMFGLVMGLLYIKTRTLLVPIACHALNNALALSMGFLPNESQASDGLTQLEQFRSNWWIGAVLLAISAPWLLRFIYKNWPQQNTPIPYLANAAQGRGGSGRV